MFCRFKASHDDRVYLNPRAYLGCKTVTHANTKVLTWRALHVQTWPRNTDRNVKHELYERYDAHLMLAFEATTTHVMIGLGVVDLVHVITKKTRGMSFLSGSSFLIWISRTQFIIN